MMRLTCAAPDLAATYAALILADGAIGYWPLSGDALDHSGNGHAGTLQHAAGSALPVVTTGPFGGLGAYEFVHTTVLFGGGGGNYITLASPASLAAGPGPFSWEGWVRFGEPMLNSVGWELPQRWLTTEGPAGRMSGIEDEGGRLNAYGAYGWFAQRLVFGDVLTLSAAPQYNSALPDALGWHHIVGIFDGTRGRIYLDGVVVATGPASAGWVYAGPAPLTAAWIAGLEGFGHFSGAIAQVANYPFALTACQVLSHWAMATTGSYVPCQLQPWLRFTAAEGGHARIVHRG